MTQLADRKDLLEIVGRARNDVYTDQLANAPRSRRAGVGCSFDRPDVATHDGRDQSGVDLLPADEDDVGGLAHRVGGFNHADEATRFHQSQSVTDLGHHPVVYAILPRAATGKLSTT